jgi:diaminopimelate epimerase
MSKVRFTKMHGCGNDYIYVNAMQYEIADPQTAAIVWSDRHKGIGSDGLVLIDRSPVPEADFSMRIFNADGSEAMMCGNASRCIGKYLYEKNLSETVPKEMKSGVQEQMIRLHTRSGIKALYLHITDGIVENVTVDMGEPSFADETLFHASLAHDLLSHIPIKDAQESVRGLFVSMGNPHYVIFTDNVNQVGETGCLLERHPAFPHRCNIEFAQLLPEGGIRTRVWERGSGITQACGTGACATAAAAARLRLAERASDIVMDGGTLHIEWCEKDRPSANCAYKKNHIYMTGPADFVFDGEIELPIV